MASNPSSTPKSPRANHTSVKLAIIAVLLSLLPSIIRFRDNFHHRPPYRSDESIALLNACAGNITLHRPLKSNGNQNGELRLHYLTTTGRCGGENQQQQHSKKRLSKKGHILLVHGTAMSSRCFTDGISDIPNGDDTVWNMLHEQNGYDVTAIDLRGHGLSSPFAGPYSVYDIGRDLELFLEKMGFAKSEQKKIHCFGHSVGFGACMSLAVHRPDLVSTLVGVGFLFDRSRMDLAAYIFSRDLVVRFLGMATLALVGRFVMKEQPPGKLSDWMHDTHMDGNAFTASGWLHHNLTEFLGRHKVPTLYLLPEYDADVGHKPEIAKEEIAMMPPGVGELVELPGHSHIIFGETGGSKKVIDAAVEFIERRNK